MRGAVVYYSRWGNGRTVAEQIAKGLEEAGHQADLVDLKKSPEGVAGEMEFIVAGSPTRAGKMAGPMKRFIKSMDGNWKNKPFAAYGTGYKKWLDSSSLSSESIEEELKNKGLKAVAAPLRVGVDHTRGPLSKGEAERAYEYGKEIGTALNNS
jgi:flavodoxin